MPSPEPRLRRRRHATLLAVSMLAVALAMSSGSHAPAALLFTCYGALHAAAVALCLSPPPARVRTLGFVAAAALLAGSLAYLGLLAVPHLAAASGVGSAVLLVVGASAFAGALGYAALLRSLLRYSLAPRALVMIALVCVVADSAALGLLRRYPAGGSAWLAILWWLAFSAGLCSAGARRPYAVREPSDAGRR